MSGRRTDELRSEQAHDDGTGDGMLAVDNVELLGGVLQM
jgi:hypothetical protein